MRLWVRVWVLEFAGCGWFNIGGCEVILVGLCGKIVVLDFWMFCCVNCLYVFDELCSFEEWYGDVLVFVGVYSLKFEHEVDVEVLVVVVEWYEVYYLVLDDFDLVIWKVFVVCAWLMFIVIDFEGYVVV